MDNYLKRADQVFARINQLAAISEHEQGTTRTFGTEAFLQGSRQVFLWMQQAGLDTRIDNIGNVRGRIVSSSPDAKTFVIASHIDTVVNAGKFDGPLGVLMGLDLLEQLVENRVSLPFHIELIAFSDEEGVRFHTTYLGSKVVTGAFDTGLLNKTDHAGNTLSSVITGMGGAINLLSHDAIAPQNWLGYYEIHIEQGPVLYERDIPVAIVTAIAGQKRAEIIFTGMAGHAGTVPMDMRKDALCAAAEFVLAVQQYALANKTNMVATVGKLEVINSASNVIPGKVACSLDLRSSDGSMLEKAYQDINKLANEIAKKHDTVTAFNLIQHSNSTICNYNLNNNLRNSILNSGIELVELVSGAGHDAVPISQVSPVSMLFVRCYKGISHNPLEDAEIKDIAAAIQVSEKFIKTLIEQYH